MTIKYLSPGGGIGRRIGLKIQRGSPLVPVQVWPRAFFLRREINSYNDNNFCKNHKDLSQLGRVFFLCIERLCQHSQRISMPRLLGKNCGLRDQFASQIASIRVRKARFYLANGLRQVWPRAFFLRREINSYNDNNFCKNHKDLSQLGRVFFLHYVRSPPAHCLSRKLLCQGL